jgi:hypothetical protein
VVAPPGECGGDEGVTQGVRSDRFGDPGREGDPADDASGAVPVEAAASGVGEDRALAALADGRVDGSDRSRVPGGW